MECNLDDLHEAMWSQGRHDAADPQDRGMTARVCFYATGR